MAEQTRPTMDPPPQVIQDGTTASDSRPVMTSETEFRTEVGGEITTSGPRLEPPQLATGTREAEGVTAATWHTGVVTAQWAIHETRNAWIQLSGLGWRKIFNGRDGAFQALVTLAAQSRQTGRQIHVRVDDDQMVHEIYLW